MTVKTVDSNQAYNQWTDVLDLALNADTDVVITRHDRPIVAVVAYADYLAVRDLLEERRTTRNLQFNRIQESRATMYASERALAKEWDTAEEDAAWRDL